MIIKDAVSGALVEVDDATGKKLLENSGWVAAKAAPAAKKAAASAEPVK